MQSVKVTEYTQTTQCKHSKVGVDVVMSKFSTPKISSKVHTIGVGHLQWVNNQNAKFKYKGIKIVIVAYYTNQTPQACRLEKMSKFNSPKKHFGLKNV